MGAGHLRWWLSGSLESRRLHHQAALNSAWAAENRFQPQRSLTSLLSDEQRAETVEFMTQLGYVLSAPAGYTVICSRHGIFGKKERGDRCGYCS